MTGTSKPAGYWAEVRAWGPVYGTGESAQYVLGTFQTISPVLALRWLRGEALHIADRLDPDPERSAWVQPEMLVGTAPVPDCPAELRVWADSVEEPEAREYIKSGHPLCETFPDADCTYSLSVCPVILPAADPYRPLPGQQTFRGDGLSHPLRAKTECADARADVIRRYQSDESAARLAREYCAPQGWFAVQLGRRGVQVRDRSAVAVVRGPGPDRMGVLML
ncbi:hypothetical protein [Streptomyces sp. NPDC002530]